MPSFTLTDVAATSGSRASRSTPDDLGLADDAPLVGDQADPSGRPARRGGPDRGRQRGPLVRDRPDPRHGDLEGPLPGRPARLGLAGRRRPGQSRLRQPDELGRPGLARRVRRAARPLRPGEQRRPLRGQAVDPDGSERHTTFGLHGKIANIPASYVAVHVGDGAAARDHGRGARRRVEALLPQVRMTTRITTTPGSNRLTVRDEFVNLKDSPARDAGALPLELRPALPRGGRAVRRPGRGGRPARRPGRARGSTITTSTAAPSRASPSRSTSSSSAARPRTAGPWPCSATGRATRGSSSGSHGAAPLLHPLEEHRRARGLRHRPGAGDQLSQPEAVREGAGAGS